MYGVFECWGVCFWGGGRWTSCPILGELARIRGVYFHMGDVLRLGGVFCTSGPPYFCAVLNVLNIINIVWSIPCYIKFMRILNIKAIGALLKDLTKAISTLNTKLLPVLAKAILTFMLHLRNKYFDLSWTCIWQMTYFYSNRVQSETSSVSESKIKSRVSYKWILTLMN